MRATPTWVVVGGVVALVALGVVGALVLGDGPGDDSANGSVPVEDLGRLDGSWTVVNDGSAPAPVQGEVRLTFGPDDRVVAATGCNTLRGAASVEDSMLVTGPLTSTRMACEPALMQQERWVGEMLASRPRLELSGPYLALLWGADEQWWVGLEQQGFGEEATTPAS